MHKITQTLLDKFTIDYLRNQGVEVVYLPRTPEISTSRIKKDLHE